MLIGPGIRQKKLIIFAETRQICPLFGREEAFPAKHAKYAK